MPRKPKTPCSHRGCPELTHSRFCDKHLKEYNKNYERYERDSAIKKRYRGAWRKIRNNYINAHPLCEQCLKDERYTKAKEVHHILPLGRGGTHSTDNLMALCKPCHSRVSVLDGDRFRNR